MGVFGLFSIVFFFFFYSFFFGKKLLRVCFGLCFLMVLLEDPHLGWFNVCLRRASLTTEQLTMTKEEQQVIASILFFSAKKNNKTTDYIH